MMVAPAGAATMKAMAAGAWCRSGCGAPSSLSTPAKRRARSIIDTGNTALYYVLGQGRAVRYGVGVGREGFTWSGVQTVTRKAEWPDWHPPAEMIARQPYLPRFMAGGPGNPLGARAMYLGSSVYRIHGTNDPSTIGKFVSSRLHPPDQRRRRRPVQPRRCRHQGRGAAEERAARLEAGTTITVRPTTRSRVLS